MSLSPDDPAIGEGAWIFVSHSHRDLKSVRRVRDALEAKGHQPLLFFLKCLGDDSEIDDLIRREIEARQFFLLCDSPNARTSRWVQQEVQLINELSGKVSLNLELHGNWEAQLETIDELSRRATVFIISSGRDHDLAGKIAADLRAHDYRLLDVDSGSIRLEGNWAEQLRDSLRLAVDTGFVLVLLSPNVFDAKAVSYELELALELSASRDKPSNVLPLIISERERTLALLASSPLYARLNVAALDFTSGEFDEKMAELRRVLTNE